MSATTLKRIDQKIVRAVLERHGRTFAQELRIDVAKGTPAPLFRLLCAAMLLGARIDAGIATEAARNLARRGWRSPRKLAESAWEERVEALNEAGYTRYQERTATMLGDLTAQLLDRWHGDLRRLRDDAGREPREERKRLTEFKGIGDVSVDIFFREIQVSWKELFPFADRRVLDAAGRLELPKDAARLAKLSGGRDYARLATALVRVDLGDDYDAVRERAG
jgi:hypothetical protein